MVNPGQELSSIDFESMIGGPLIAVVNAQAQAALSTVNFIKSVGFKAGESEDIEESETGEPIYVTFKYPKEISPYQPATDTSVAVAAQIQEMKLEVPILTMLPIPFIRIEETTIDFNAKITSMEYRTVDDTYKEDKSAAARGRLPFFASAKLKVSSSYQRSTTEGSNVNRTYSLAVHVKAVQDEMPAGMEKVLGILEEAIRGQPVVS